MTFQLIPTVKTQTKFLLTNSVTGRGWDGTSFSVSPMALLKSPLVDAVQMAFISAMFLNVKACRVEVEVS